MSGPAKLILRAGAKAAAMPPAVAEIAARLAAQSAPSQYIRAYHASPHDFDRFDASKIGTGLGVQARGHGLYFSADEGYPAKLRDNFHAFSSPGSAEEAASDYLANARGYGYEGGDLHRSAAELLRQDRIDPPTDSMRSDPQMYYQALEMLSRGEGRILPPRAHMYEVEIGRPESSLLDWDAPISYQPGVVQKVFGDFAMDKPGDGGRIYRDIATRHGEAFDDDMTGVLANLEAAKELLAEGIPGVRFVGQHAGHGTGVRNYVMFPGTEDKIRILRKFAVPGAIGASAASQFDDGEAGAAPMR